MTDEELAAAAQKLAMETEFPPEERKIEPTRFPLPPAAQAAYDARIRSGYYIPGVGAFDQGEGPEAHDALSVPSPNQRAFHIGQSYDKHTAEMVCCARCGCIVFHVGVGDYYTALRCTNCGREWCQHEG